MKNKKTKELYYLKILYLTAFITIGILFALTHIFPQPFFMPFRFPHYLEMMPTFLGVSWPMSFEIYHYILYALVLIGSLNVLGIIFYPKFRKTAIFSSFVGIFLIFPMILFFFFVFLSVNASTAVIYGLYCVVLLIVDVLTFKALLSEKRYNA